MKRSFFLLATLVFCDCFSSALPGSLFLTALSDLAALLAVSRGTAYSIEQFQKTWYGQRINTSFLMQTIPPLTTGASLFLLLPYQRIIKDFWYILLSSKRLSPQAAERALREVLAYAQCVMIVNKISHECNEVIALLNDYKEQGENAEALSRLVPHFSERLALWGMEPMEHVDDLVRKLINRAHEGIAIDDVIEALRETMETLMSYWRNLAQDQQAIAHIYLKKCNTLLYIERFIMYVLHKDLAMEPFSIK